MATRKRHSPEQIVRKLMAGDRLLAEGKDTAAVCRELGVSEATYHRWRNQFGGLKAEDAKKLKDLERENATLKRLLADAELEKDPLREIARGAPRPGTPAGSRSSPSAGAGVSERFACRVTGQHRVTQRHESAADTPEDPDAALREWLRAYAKNHPRRGFRPAYHNARGEGWIVNHKKIQRLWREEGLRVPQRRRRKRHGTSTAVTAMSAEAPNRVWAVDFQFDVTTDGRPVKIVSIVDEHTPECLGGMVERSITSEHLISKLNRLTALRGAFPAVQRCDNGPELAGGAMAQWADGPASATSA